jgi:hypothetical protein
MAGIKITEYTTTQTSFANEDEFDVSAYVAPSVPFISRKYTWAGIKAAIIALIGQAFPSGTNGQTMRKGTSAWQATSEVFIGSDVGIGTTSPTGRLHVEKDINTITPIGTFNNSYSGSATSSILGMVVVQYGEYGSVIKPYAKYGDTGDLFVKNNATNSNVNIISKGADNFKGGVNFFTDGDFAGPGEYAPLQIAKEGRLLWKDMVTNGFAHDEGFKITNVDTGGHGTTGEYIEVQIKGVTRYIELFS